MRLIEIPDDGIIREYIYEGKDTVVGERRIDLSNYSTVDAVEVVRCRECMFSKKMDNREPMYKCINICRKGHTQWVGSDDFCSCGEREEE